MHRRIFIRDMGAAVSLAPGFMLRAATTPPSNPHLTKINPNYLVKPEEVYAWHVGKDSKGGPTMTGSASWKHYLQMIEKELHVAGAVGVFRNAWTFTRWYTSEFPDDSNWSLHLDGEKIRVASYGCNSGRTPDEGITGQLVVYKDGMSLDSLQGKIVIIRKERATTGRTGANDYEFLSNPDTFANPVLPRSESAALNPSGLMGFGTGAFPYLAAEADRQVRQALIEAGAIGALIVVALSHDALSGVYTYPVPALHNIPTLYIDRDTGVQLLEAASVGKAAKLRLISKTEDAEAYQLFCYLPGKDYGTLADKQILLITHTDGPSISQENGGLGILGIVKYFSHIPQAERPRTLMVFLDCRHYMPGAERSFASEDYSASHPDVYKNVIAAVGIEHLGQIQVAEENGEPYHRTNLMELSSVWVTKNQNLVDLAIRAVKDNHLKRVQVQCPGRKGIHGGEQGPWSGLGGNIVRTLGIPGSATMGLMTAYWSTKARMDYLDANHFVDQVATMSQICGELMIADVASIKG